MPTAALFDEFIRFPHEDLSRELLQLTAQVVQVVVENVVFQVHDH